MNFIYEEGGEIKGACAVGPALAGADHWQAQTQYGKRIKLKAKEVWLSWNTGDLATIMQEAEQIAKEVDMDLLWECSPLAEFKFEQVAKEYFGDAVQTEQVIALAMALQNTPIYFRRKGRGNFARAPEEQLKAALIAVERKQREALLQQEWIDQLCLGTLPPEINDKSGHLLWNPDKNGIHYKAVAQASQQLGISIAQLFLQLGAIHSALEIHQGKFLKEHFARGVGFEQSTHWNLTAWDQIVNDLPQSLVKAFSIDDASTTEIDDALSVTLQADGRYEIGIHIAVPGLAIRPGSEIDKIAQARMSTVYFPGGKITMLPSEVVDVFSLQEGGYRPALSLYVTLNAQGEIDLTTTHSQIEKVMIQRNLRLHEIEDIVTQESLNEPDVGNIPMHQELAILWLGAQSLFKSRQETRVKNGQRPEVIGPPDPNSLPRDFHFTITDEKHLSIPADVLFKHPLDDSHWQVSISSRQRGSVTDLIVAEWMIFSNQTWGGLLANHELPAIFRAQQGWGPQRTRMQTTPCRHEGLGIENYAWCTSPLRRYSDLVNQWQLIAYLEKGVMAKLAAPFVSKDVKIMGICADFDATYTAYNMYQQIAEKYWCLKWLLQQGLPWTGRTRLLKDAVVRVEAIPLRLTVPELMSTPRGATVLVEITQIDLLSLNASVRVVEVLGDLNQVKEQDFEEELLIVSPQEILPTELVDVSQLTTNLVEIESSPEYQSPNLSQSFSLNEVVEFNQDDASIKKS